MSKYHSLSDQRLLELIKSSDRDAFEEVYNRYCTEMARYTVKVIRDEDEAMDIVQEIFISIWRRRESINIQISLSSYLMRSTRNLSIRYIEKNLSKENFLETLIDHAERLSPPVINDIELRELEQQIQDAIDRLPIKMREIFHLSRFENLSYLEIADRLGISDMTVKKQIHNALKRLRNDFGRDTSFSTVVLLLFYQNWK